MIAFSHGYNINDAQPRQHSAPDFDAFVKLLDADRARKKEPAGYICGPLNGDGKRCAAGALPRRWLALDLDRVEADVLPRVRAWVARFSGVSWPTHSSTPDAPRERVLIELDREANREECLRVGDQLARDLADEFGDAVKLDSATHRGEQPVFLPPPGVTLERLHGMPLRVDDYATAPSDQQQAQQQQPGRAGLGEKAEGAREAVKMERTPEAIIADAARRIRSALVHGQADDEEPLQLLRLADFLRAVPPQEFVADDLLRRGWLYTLSGPTGHGKTGVAAVLALCVGTGKKFAGHETTRGRVVYVAGENPDDVRLRFLITADAMGIDAAAADVQVLDRSLILADRMPEMLSLLNEAQPSLLIVDTDQAVSLDGDVEENANSTRMAHAKRLRALTRVSSRPTVVDLCHPRAGATRESLVPRGGSSLLAEVDGNLCLWRDGDVVELFTDGAKFRGSPASVTFHKVLRTHPAARDTKGRDMSIPYFEAMGDAQAQVLRRQAWTDGNLVLMAMVQEPRGSQSDWARTAGFIGRDGEPRKDKVNRLLRALERDGLTKQSRGGYWNLTPAGKKEAVKP